MSQQRNQSLQSTESLWHSDWCWLARETDRRTHGRTDHVTTTIGHHTLFIGVAPRAITRQFTASSLFLQLASQNYATTCSKCALHSPSRTWNLFTSASKH